MFSSKMENLVTKVRVLISSVVFGTTSPKAICTDHNKPLSVPRGADSLMVHLHLCFFQFKKERVERCLKMTLRSVLKYQV